MHKLLATILTYFLFCTTVSADSGDYLDDCEYLRNPSSFSFKVTFNGVGYFHLASAETEEMAKAWGINILLRNRYPRPELMFTLPSSTINVVISFDDQTGKITAESDMNEDGYSAWIPIRLCGEDKEPQPREADEPENKIPLLNARVIY